MALVDLRNVERSYYLRKPYVMNLSDRQRYTALTMLRLLQTETVLHFKSYIESCNIFLWGFIDSENKMSTYLFFVCYNRNTEEAIWQVYRQNDFLITHCYGGEWKPIDAVPGHFFCNRSSVSNHAPAQGRTKGQGSSVWGPNFPK